MHPARCQFSLLPPRCAVLKYPVRLAGSSVPRTHLESADAGLRHRHRPVTVRLVLLGTGLHRGATLSMMNA
jgi:hypothetical protein